MLPKGTPIIAFMWSLTHGTAGKLIYTNTRIDINPEDMICLPMLRSTNPIQTFARHLLRTVSTKNIDEEYMLCRFDPPPEKDHCWYMLVKREYWHSGTP